MQIYVALLFLLYGCASVQPGALSVSDGQRLPSAEPGFATLSFASPTPAVTAPAEMSLGSALLVEPVEPAATITTSSSASSTASYASVAASGLRSSRFTIKGGHYGSEEDGLDDGWIGNLSWMRFISSLMAIEFELGYFEADGDESPFDVEVWGVPIMINGRLNAPLGPFDIYGGLGLGTIYYDLEVNTIGLTATDDGFLFAGNAFVGATINLADAIAVGLEGKYYVTEEIEDADEGLDAFAVMLTLGFSR